MNEIGLTNQLDMETYGKILLIAMPIFLILVLLEKWYGWKTGKDTVRIMDMISSLSSGVTNVTKDVLGLSFAIISYGWMYENLALIHIQETIWVYIIAFIALDFSGYCIHRIQHTTNVFWNAHIIHHSSEEFNLACALRQSISVFFRIFTFFLLPAALLGVPGNVIAIVAPLHLFIQFWYHTQLIGKMGFLEKIIVTPSHHRVHHAINPEYIDKNYSQVFIIWDKMFGTFQEEQEHIPPVYGITRPVATWNPVKINFQHMFLLISDAWRTKSWNDKMRIWFMPTGWRPADVAEKYPVYKIKDVYDFEKYNPVSSKALQTWSFIQLFILLGFISYLFGNLASIGSPGIFLYGLFIFAYIYAMTELMDGNPIAYVWEGIKLVIGVYLIINTNGWFGAEKLFQFIPHIVFAYLLAAMYLSINLSIKRKVSVPSESSVS
jgi:sterol desaturase/sphingolipid hydroxylase (fatty acid hydroxylase superfamily)